MTYKPYSTGDQRLDKLITDYGNAIFDCGEWSEPGDNPTYDDDRKYQTYKEASAICEQARWALYTYLRDALGKGSGGVNDG